MPRNIKLAENEGVAFFGIEKGGAFDVDDRVARAWLEMSGDDSPPLTDVLRPWIDSDRLELGGSQGWIVDFGLEMGEEEAARYRAPFAYLAEHVRPLRSTWKAMLARYWWRHAEPRLRMRAAIESRKRYLATARRARYPIFRWVDSSVLPDSGLVVLAADQDSLFAIVHSRFHRLWTQRQMGPADGPDARYSPAAFESFPLPPALIVDGRLASGESAPEMAEAGRCLDRLREQWLKLPGDGADSGSEPPRTLGSLYDERPAWLIDAHAALDESVARAYGWPASIGDEDAISRLASSNFSRSGRKKLHLALSA
jgi:hypothetical protein